MQIPFISGLLKRAKHTGAGFVVAISGNGVHFAQLKNVAGRPQVVTYAFHQLPGIKTSGITSAVLEKIRKGLHVGDFRFATLLAPGEYLFFGEGHSAQVTGGRFDLYLPDSDRARFEFDH